MPVELNVTETAPVTDVALEPEQVSTEIAEADSSTETVAPEADESTTDKEA